MILSLGYIIGAFKLFIGKVMSLSVLLLIIVIAVSLVLFVYFESTSFRVIEYEIKTDKNIPRDINIVFISDLHNTNTDCLYDRFRKKNRYEGIHTGRNKRLLNAIDEAAPDFVLLSGDMVTSYMQPRYNSEIALDFLKELSSNHKVFYGLGNHEMRYLEDQVKFKGKYDELKKYVNSLGISFLENKAELIDELNVGIYGLLIPMTFYRRVITQKLSDNFVEKSLGSNDGDKFNILLAHTPDHFDDYAKWEPDLVLSGHVHGGIVCIPHLGGVISPQLKLFPKYDAGKFKKDKSVMILSRGIGWHTVPVRIFNKAEMIVIKVEHS